MPARSKAQARLMYAVASGKAKKKPKGLSKKEAKEFVKGINYKNLPEKVKNKTKHNALKSLSTKY